MVLADGNTGNEATDKVVSAINKTQASIQKANVVCGQVTQLGHGVEALAIETRLLLNTLDAGKEFESEIGSTEDKNRTVEKTSNPKEKFQNS